MTSISHQEESNLLFRAYQNSNISALEELYRRWHEYVTWRVKESNLFSHPDIEDISANVWVLVQQHAKKWDVDRSGWYSFLNYKIRLAISSEKALRDRRRKILRDNGFSEVIEKPIPVNAEGRRFDVNSGLLEQPYTHSNASEHVDPEPTALETLIESEKCEILEKAIRVCQFSPITEKVLRLRLKGMTLEKIKQILGLKQRSCVKLHLQYAFEDLKEVIDPVTFEVATIAPKVRRKRERVEHLKRAGEALKRCLEQKSLMLIEVSRQANINLYDMMGFIKGKSRPQAPRLHRLASFLGDPIYDIYMPLLDGARWQEQGQSLWRMRVRCGLPLKKVSKMTGIDYSLLTQYEAGMSKITQTAETILSNLYTEMSC